MTKVGVKTVLLCLFALSAVANAQEDMRGFMLDMMRESVAQTCDDPEFLSCMGLGRGECAQKANQVVDACASILPAQLDFTNEAKMAAFESEMEACMSRESAKRGIDVDQADQCDGGYVDAAEDEAEYGFEDDEMSDEDIAAMQEHYQREAKREVARMQRALKAQANAAGSAGMTLPVYPQAEVQSHFAQGMEVAGRQSNPVAQYRVTEKPSTVLAFYREELPEFKYLEASGTQILAEELVAGGQYPLDYLQIPHIAVSSNRDGSSRLEINYRK